MLMVFHLQSVFDSWLSCELLLGWVVEYLTLVIVLKNQSFLMLLKLCVNTLVNTLDESRVHRKLSSNKTKIVQICCGKILEISVTDLF